MPPDDAQTLAADLLGEHGGNSIFTEKVVLVLQHMSEHLPVSVEQDVLISSAWLLPTLGHRADPLFADVISLDTLRMESVPPSVLRVLSWFHHPPWMTRAEFEEDLMSAPVECRILIGAQEVAETWLEVSPAPP